MPVSTVVAVEEYWQQFQTEEHSIICNGFWRRKMMTSGLEEDCILVESGHGSTVPVTHKVSAVQCSALRSSLNAVVIGYGSRRHKYCVSISFDTVLFCCQSNFLLICYLLFTLFLSHFIFLQMETIGLAIYPQLGTSVMLDCQLSLIRNKQLEFLFTTLHGLLTLELCANGIVGIHMLVVIISTIILISRLVQT